jgi:hypothetical protein
LGTGPELGQDEPGGGFEADPGGGPAAGDSGPARGAPAPALVADVGGRIEQIQAAASAASVVLAGGGDLRAALAGMDEIYDQAAQALYRFKTCRTAAGLGFRKISYAAW